MSNVDSDKMADGKAEQPDFAMKSPAPSPYPYRDTPAPQPREPGTVLKVAELTDRANIAVGMLNDANADFRGCLNRLNMLADRLVGETESGLDQDISIPDPIGTFGMIEHNIAQYMYIRRRLDVALARLEIL